MEERRSPKNFSDIAYAQLCEMLNEPAWANGGRLPSEERLAGALGMSRRVVRQALERLRNEGRIVSRKGSGSYVRPPSPADDEAATFGAISIRSLDDLHACFRFRRAVEVAGAGEAAERAPPELVDDIEAALEEFRSALPGKGDFELDYKFHLAVARASRNPFFIETIKGLKPSLRMGHGFSRSLRIVPLNESARVYEEHARVLRAIQARDPASAREAIDAHIGAGLARLFGKTSA
ncbi:FCD domain-containing protein [Acuticoccus sp. M5D2P5]|uniref:FadR/GntR family transcriptional regulator n=1 Tax=Acuticoccus kalidii TaxID=2910977 RepID=UPI001F2179E8|nr:FCD domain-containing protein [Acuticoccus kalidii]MCF3936167.1 FCD domain-containing protein [Acuticoccus kalidii]